MNCPSCGQDLEAPALGEDRSVRLGDVLDALREHDFDGPISRAAIDFIAREFSGDPEGGENNEHHR